MKGALRRVSASLAHELMVQYRNSFPSRVLRLALLWILGFAILRKYPQPDMSGSAPWGELLLLPVLSLHLFLIAFGGMALGVRREIAEGSLAALDLTPLRPHEYLASRVGALLVHGLYTSLLIAPMALGWGFRPLFLAAGSAVAICLFALAGFTTVAGFRRGTSRLLASLGCFLFCALPALLSLPWAARLLPIGNRWLYVHPLQPALALMRASFRPVPGVEIAYAAGCSLLWLGIGLVACRRALGRLRRTP